MNMDRQSRYGHFSILYGQFRVYRHLKISEDDSVNEKIRNDSLNISEGLRSDW